MNWLLIFATLREASSTIQALSAARVAGNRYSFPGGEILLCGMGLEAAARSMAAAPAAHVRWLNIGAAGSFDPGLAIGTTLSVGRIALLNNKSPSLLVDPHAKALLYSSSTPVYAAPKGGVHNALVDMEGYAIALAAQKKKVPLMVRKIVSDHCSVTSHADILANIDRLSSCMAEEVVSMLRQETSRQASVS